MAVYGRDTLAGSPIPNMAVGGPDSDIVLVRNGVSDAVDCGEGIDAVQGDQAGVDSLSACEVIDLVATSMATPTPVAERTHRRAAALKKCRKLKRRRARRRCVKHAKKLPV